MSRETPWRAAPLLLLAGLSALVARTTAAQDLDAQLKWTEAKVVHYRIAGDFAGKLGIMSSEHPMRNAAITDHIEFEFDWDNQEMALLGSTVLRNSPTKIVALDPSPIEGCPPARIDTGPEFATVTKVTAMSVLLQIEFKQQSAKGALPWIGRGASSCGTVWEEVSSSERTQEISLQLPPGMMLAMAKEMTGYDFSKDGKSMLTKPENGWTWSITPSIVR
jgi:hypothetical protein